MTNKNPMNLLELAMTQPLSSNYQVPYSDNLLPFLNKNGSTWQALADSEAMESQKELGVVHAKTHDGRNFVSHESIGPAEMLVGNWLRKRVSSGCRTVTVPKGTLTSSQHDAATLVCNNPISVLSGFPGTGKTTTAKAIYDSFVNSGYSVALCSFMGAAASRLGSAVGGPASTIHRLLEYSHGSFQRNKDNKINYDVVIIDEAGTLGVVLLCNLLYALMSGAILVFIGDPYQLPSVDNGNILQDISEFVPHARLTEIIRTEADGPIGLASKSIFEGKVPESSQRGDDGFFFIPVGDDMLIEKAYSVHKRLYLASGTVSFADIRTMAPTNILCDEFNSYCLEQSTGEVIPVVCRQNNKSHGIFNGDFGVLAGDLAIFEKDGHRIEVPFSDTYSKIRYGMGVTPFVMQGKECHSGQYMCPSSGAGYPSRNEIYTAVTRAKSRFCVTGSGTRFRAMVENKKFRRRTTLLREFFQDTAVLQ